MELTKRNCRKEEDYWRIRNFLREVFLLNDRLEHSWSVPRLDYWRWHFIQTCRVCESVEKGMALWEKTNGKIAALLTDLGDGEIRMHVHPQFRSAELENEMLAYAEQHFSEVSASGRRILYLPIFADDIQRQGIVQKRGFTKREGWGHHWRRGLDVAIPDAPVVSGYVIRSMGTLDEHPARSWASWRAFHSDEPDSNYDGDCSWYQNLQSAPLYRRDLDIVATAPDGSVAAFCTCYYDDYTRSAVTVLVGTAAEHWKRGLGKAIISEGLRRLKILGCTRVFASAYDPPAHALYRSVMQAHKVTETWIKRFNGENK